MTKIKIGRKPNFEFVSYSGQYPNLCSGELVFKIDGHRLTWDIRLISGGSITFDSHWDEHVETAPWRGIDSGSFRKYPELKEWEPELLAMINENIPHGCCGGCV